MSVKVSPMANVLFEPLHGAKFDATTGHNVAGVQMRIIPPETMQKPPSEMVRQVMGM